MKANGNEGDWNGGYSQDDFQESFRILDSLPIPIRRAIKDAPYDYSVLDIAAAWRDYRNMVFPFVDPVEFAREMVGNFSVDVRKNSLTDAEKGRYWFSKHSGARLTQRRRRAIMRGAYPHALPTPRSRT